MAETGALDADQLEPGGWRAQVRHVLTGSREAIRIAYRDPEHVSERLALLAADRHAEPSREWAESIRRAHPDTDRAELAEALRVRSANVARIDGAIAGTPFYLALVPGYASYLWQEARMTLRTAALYGRDPGSLHTAAEMLALRGVHPTVEAAEAELVKVGRTAPPPVEARRSLRTWIDSGRALLVFGGFISASEPKEPGDRRRIRLKDVFGLVLGVALWAITWIFPVSFMIAMSWACESHCRQLGRRTLALYDGEATTPEGAIAAARRWRDKGHTKRRIVRGTLVALSIAIPIVFVAYVNHERQSTGITWLGALGGLVALSLVIGAAVYGSRR